MDKRINYALQVGKELNMVKPESYAIIVTGWRSGTGYTNTTRIIQVTAKRDMIHVLSKEKGLDNMNKLG